MLLILTHNEIILALFGFVFVFIILFILKRINIISQFFKLSAFEKFNEYLKESVEERFFLYQYNGLPSELTKEEEQKFQKVINSLNKISVMLEFKMIPPKLVFGICHTLIIRCEYKLGYYMDYQELKIGGRYGRRVRKLAKRAKKYHDVNPMHRIHPIKLTQGDKTIIIYETKYYDGFAGIIQKLEWYLRRKFKIY